MPSNSPDLLTAATKSGKSPWTIAFKNAGAPQLGNVVNVVMYLASAPFSSRVVSKLTLDDKDHGAILVYEFGTLRCISKSGHACFSRAGAKVLC